MVFHWSLSGSKSQVSRTLLSILAVLNNAVVWIVSASTPTSKFSSLFNNHLVTVPKAPITTGIIVTFMGNIMAEGFRFMPLGLVKLRTFRSQCMGYLGATLTQGLTRARGVNVSLRDVTIAQIGNGVTECGAVTHRKRAEDLGRF